MTHSHCLCQWLVLFVIFSSQLSYFSSSQKKENSIYLTEIKNDYWMTLSEEWRMIKIDESVVSRSQRLRRITPSEICINLCVVRKLNLVTVFFILFKYFLMHNIVSSIKMARSLVSLQLAYFSGFLWYSFLWVFQLFCLSVSEFFQQFSS